MVPGMQSPSGPLTPAGQAGIERTARQNGVVRRTAVSWISLAGTGALAGAAVLYVSPLAVLRHGVMFLSEDSEFAPGYSESAFRRVAAGDSEASVRAALGAPLSDFSAEPFIAWLYAPDPQPDFPATGQADPTVSYTVIRFGEDGRFAGGFGQIAHGSSGGLLGAQITLSYGDGVNSLALKNAEIERLKAEKATPEQIEARFGAPIARFESLAARWLQYSRSPGSKNYRLRLIGIDREGRVCSKRRELYWD